MAARFMSALGAGEGMVDEMALRRPEDLGAGKMVETYAVASCHFW